MCFAPRPGRYGARLGSALAGLSAEIGSQEKGREGKGRLDDKGADFARDFVSPLAPKPSMMLAPETRSRGCFATLRPFGF